MPGEDTRADGPRGGRATDWKQDVIWRLEAVGFQALFAFLRLLGVERASALGGWLLRTLGPLTGTQKTVMRNLRIAFPDMPADEREALALAQWDQTGRTFAELAVMDHLTPEGGRVEVVGMERLHALRDSGKPAVLISGHLANFEVMAAVIMASGVPCQVTYRAANNPYVDALIRQSRERYGIKLFAPKGDGTRDGRGRSIQWRMAARKDRASAPTGCHDARRSEERMGFGGRSGAMGLWLQSLGPVGGHPCPRQKPVWP